MTGKVATSYDSSQYYIVLDGWGLGHYRCAECSCEKVLENNLTMSEIMQSMTGTFIFILSIGQYQEKSALAAMFRMSLVKMRLTFDNHLHRLKGYQQSPIRN